MLFWRHISGTLLALGVLVSGRYRYNWRTGVTDSAALIHSCPPERIIVLDDNGNAFARVVQLDVCGQRRVFQDQGGRSGYVWVDVTQPTSGNSVRAPVAAAPPPAPAPPHAVSPGAVVAAPDSDFGASLRGRVDAAAPAILACTGADSTAVEASWSSGGSVHITVRGTDDAAVVACAAAGIGSIIAPAEAADGRIIHAVTRR